MTQPEAIAEKQRLAAALNRGWDKMGVLIEAGDLPTSFKVADQWIALNRRFVEHSERFGLVG